MAEYLVDLRDITFNLYEYLGIEKLTEYPKYQDFNKEMFDMVLDQGLKQAKDVFAPANALGDEKGVKFEDGKVELPQEIVEAVKLYGESGWIGATADPEWGGQGLPATVMVPVGEFFVGANCSATMGPGLARAGAPVIENFGTDEMKNLYLEKMYTGQWGGTMCLTEPQAGSAVGDVKCAARKEGDHYKISGTKSFITCGDHNLNENIIHLVLARTEGAPDGVKGISLFIVPKIRVNPDGSMGEFNDINIGGVEHKLGLHASPTCVMNFGENDNCIGHLIGEECQGITYMFQMMNEARIGVGIQALGIAGTAYLNALQYTQERIQGVEITEIRNPDAPRVPIVKHPDIRRMLLEMKAFTEGMRALLYKAAYYNDLMETTEDEEEEAKYNGFVELVTPICKAWCSDMAFRVTEWAIQCYGGYGFCAEYPAEQYMRDVKIASLYEGTNGIQALDLLGRKVAMKGGMLFMNLMTELNEFVEKNKSHPTLGENVGRLEKAKDALAQVTMKFGEIGASGDALYPVLYATPYLEMFGDVMVAQLLLDHAIMAQDKFDAICKEKGADSEEARTSLCEENDEAKFYWGKVCSAEFFVTQVLPRAHGRAESMLSGSRGPLKVVF